MALRPCPRCGKMISSTVVSCPYCAGRAARARKRVRLLIVGSVATVLLAGVGSLLMWVKAHGPIVLKPTTEAAATTESAER